jgi:hypothetical protein
LPWLSFAVAIIRDDDAAGGFVPAATLVALLFVVRDIRDQSHAASASPS